jgi:hypothetical protein
MTDARFGFAIFDEMYSLSAARQSREDGVKMTKVTSFILRQASDDDSGVCLCVYIEFR